MSEMSSVHGVSFSDWQSFLLWEESGSPMDWLMVQETIDLCYDHRAKLEKKWGAEV